MGCTSSTGLAAESGSVTTEVHPWSVEGSSGSSTWDTAPDDEEIRVFYEYAVDRRTRRDIDDEDSCAVSKRKSEAPGHAMGHRLSLAVNKMKSVAAPRMGHTTTSRRKETLKSGSKGSRSMRFSVTAGSLPSDDDEHAKKDYFLTVERLYSMAKDLGFQDLGRDEMARIFCNIPVDQNGKVGQEQFASAVKGGVVATALRLLVQKLHKGFAYGFRTPADYDFKLPSSANYRMDTREFTEEFAHLRRGIDYAYHNNYTMERQRWQDEVIKSTIVRSSEQPAPWLVFTCGPMGVGKGYCMNWMSQHGFFPLENIVHVDPDAFKLMMPEWPKYVKQSGQEAGTLCHMESSMMMEIAQWAAMDRRQNVWIDGSLRNASFYAQVFEDIRVRYPHYKISIMYIYAGEAIIRERIKVRAERTGRNVPESLIQASLGAMDKALNLLTPLCDFVARINNSGTIPVLTAFETVDTKGSWNVLKDRFAHKYEDGGEFPQWLAPLPLVRLHEKDVALLTRNFEQGTGDQLELRLNDHVELQRPVLGKLVNSTLLQRLGQAQLNPKKLVEAAQEVMLTPRGQQKAAVSSLTLVTSPMSEVTLSSHGRKLAGIPEEADAYFWVFPLGKERQDIVELTKDERVDPLMQLLFQGGFCYCNKEKKKVLSVHAISHKREEMFLQFDSPERLPRNVIEKMKKHGRFYPVAAPYLRQHGASKFCWVMPGEIFAGMNVGGGHGAFVYLMEGQTSGLLFPVLSA
jgi:predicted ABC-type ATPase